MLLFSEWLLRWWRQTPERWSEFCNIMTGIKNCCFNQVANHYITRYISNTKIVDSKTKSEQGNAKETPWELNKPHKLCFLLLSNLLNMVLRTWFYVKTCFIYQQSQAKHKPRNIQDITENYTRKEIQLRDRVQLNLNVNYFNTSKSTQ